MLKRAGLWSKFDLFYDRLRAETKANANINLVNPGSFTLTEYGGVSYEAGYGTKYNGTSGYLDSGWVQATHASKYQTTNNHIGSWEVSNVANTNDPTMSVIGTGRINLITRTGGGGYSSALSATTILTSGTSSTSVGHTVATRTGNAFAVHKNGSTTPATTGTFSSSTAVSARSLVFGARNNAGTIDQFSSRYVWFLHVGAYLTPAEVNALYAALAVYAEAGRSYDLYASSVLNAGIPVGVDATGLGSSAYPFLTLDKAATTVSAGGHIYLNGDNASPTAYKHATRLQMGNYELAAVEALGAKLQATTSTAEVLNVAPGAGGHARIGALIIDGQNANPQGVELSNSETATYQVTLNGTKIERTTYAGIWTSNIICFGQLTLNDVVIDLADGATTVQHRLGAGASVTVNGGTFTNSSLSTGSFAALFDLRTVAAGTSASFTDVTADAVMKSTYAGGSITGLLFENIAQVTISGGDISVDGSAAAKATNGLTIQASQTTNDAQNVTFNVASVSLTIKANAAGSAKGITVGFDGTTDTDYSNGKLDDGVINECLITGADTDTQTSGFHAYLIASHSTCLFTNNVAIKCWLGFGVKEAAPSTRGGTVTDFTRYGVIYKASRAGCDTTGVTTTSVAGNDGAIHVAGVTNPTTGNNCVGTTHSNNFHINDGADDVVFVQIDEDQDVTLSGNTYYNRSGTLAEFPWQYKGVNYATFEDWKREVEPDAQWYDPFA